MVDFKKYLYKTNLLGDIMNDREKLLIKELLSNLRVDIWEVGFMRCPQTWREIDYKPNYNKFYFIVDGYGWLKIGDKEYNPLPGQMYIMPQGVKQSYSFTENKNTYLKYWIHFTATIGDINLFDLVKTPAFFDVQNKEEVNITFCKLLESFNNTTDITAHLNAKAYMYQLISLFLDGIGYDNITLKKAEEINRLDAVLHYIDNHLADNIAIKELAAEAFLHPNYFIRLFKTSMGLSTINYINKKRMEKAKKLLSTMDTTISDIARQTGFYNISYFSKMFKKYTGLTPSEYRNSHNLIL